MQTVSQGVNNTAQKLERGIKSIIPAEQEPLIDEGKAIFKRYTNMPFGTKMESEICKARNTLRNLHDFPQWIDGKVKNLTPNHVYPHCLVCPFSSKHLPCFENGMLCYPSFPQQLVASLVKQADALLFITSFRAGIFMTGHFGSGLVIARSPDGNGWSAPSAINYFGTGLGLQMGVDVTDYIVIINNQKAIKNFIGAFGWGYNLPLPHVIY